MAPTNVAKMEAKYLGSVWANWSHVLMMTGDGHHRLCHTCRIDAAGSIQETNMQYRSKQLD